MTARNDVRRGRLDGRADGRAERGFAAEGPTLPERLLEAREHKGVDVYRAERDTKIRARYLQALEAGEYAELPGAVYTKGFLRNYALYLGLDPDDVIRQWRHERGDSAVPNEPVLAVPRPLAAPRRALTFSPVIVVGALLTVLIGVFAVYIGIQLVRFAKPPTLEVTSPATAVLEVSEDATQFTLAGTSTPKATVTIQEAGREQPYRVSADATGRWTAAVQLRRGRNEFTISAVDPETMKPSESTEKVFITVPFVVLEAPTLTIHSPADGARFENGAIPVKGSTTNATKVSVSATYSGPVAGQPSSVAPAGGKGATVGPKTVAVEADGAFETALGLSTGTWQVSVTATSAEGKATTVTRDIAIRYKGVTLVVEVKNGRAWIKVWVDGKVSKVTGSGGKVFNSGKVLTFTAKRAIEVRTGKSSSTYFTLNGKDLGRMSNKGNPETWRFEPRGDPVRTNRS
ncbi:MAG TPA: helix-turn-helix domain-containing protein [Candidatus Limnocylindrales bacterium]|nr:helix-turn-helix domain-containing protein [Candidatus Limnocylindrales bacterium]